MGDVELVGNDEGSERNKKKLTKLKADREERFYEDQNRNSIQLEKLVVSQSRYLDFFNLINYYLLICIYSNGFELALSSLYTIFHHNFDPTLQYLYKAGCITNHSVYSQR